VCFATRLELCGKVWNGHEAAPFHLYQVPVGRMQPVQQVYVCKLVKMVAGQRMCKDVARRILSSVLQKRVKRLSCADPMFDDGTDTGGGL
jgi:hypothetical protein